MPGGRPSLYREEYCEAVVECCAQGYSLTSFAAKIGTSRRVLNEWMDAHHEFFLACARAKSAALLWHEENARAVCSGGGSGGQSTLIQFMMKNFGADDFREKAELGITGQMTVEQRNASLIDARELLARSFQETNAPPLLTIPTPRISEASDGTADEQDAQATPEG